MATALDRPTETLMETPMASMMTRSTTEKATTTLLIHLRSVFIAVPPVL